MHAANERITQRVPDVGVRSLAAKNQRQQAQNRRGCRHENGPNALEGPLQNGLIQYNKEVKDKTFPKKENWFTISDDEFEQLQELL